MNVINAGTPWRAIVLEALAGVLAGVALGFVGGFAGPWLMDTLAIGRGGDPLISSLFGTFISSILGIGLGITLAGRALAQRGAAWAAWLGAVVGALLGYGLVALVPALTQSVLGVWAAIGGSALTLSLLGYNSRRQ